MENPVWSGQQSNLFGGFEPLGKKDPKPLKDGQNHLSPRQTRAIANLVRKGMRPGLAAHPTYYFYREDGTEEKIHIDDIVAEYDSDRREETRARAAARRMEKKQ